MALAKAGFVGVAGFVVAQVAAHALFVFRALFVLRQDRVAAAVAQFVRADFQAMADADAAIEDKAVALPCAVFGRHFL